MVNSLCDNNEIDYYSKAKGLEEVEDTQLRRVITLCLRDLGEVNGRES